jgi:hypothetical protein
MRIRSTLARPQKPPLSECPTILPEIQADRLGPFNEKPLHVRCPGHFGVMVNAASGDGLRGSPGYRVPSPASARLGQESAQWTERPGPIPGVTSSSFEYLGFP